MISIRCPADYYVNPQVKTRFPTLFTFARLYKKSRLFWLMTFFFLLPLIYTVLGAVIIAVKSAQYRQSGSGVQLKARDERRMNALIVAILVGFLLCWIPHYSYEVRVVKNDYRINFQMTCIFDPFVIYSLFSSLQNML